MTNIASAAPWWRVLPVWARQEATLLLREPVAVIFSLVFPLIMYLFMGIPYGKMEIAPGVRFIDTMYGALIVTVAANLLLMGLPIYLAELRAKGTVRRYAILPLPGWIFAVAVLLSTLLLVTCASLIITAVIGIRDGLRPEVLNPQFIGLLIGCILWLSALGFFLGALRISSRTTQALSAVLFFTLFFGSGAAVPIDGLPEVVQNILDWNPLKQWLDVIVAV